MAEDRPRIVERTDKPADPRQNRSNGMVALGVVLLLFAVVSTASTDGEPVTGAILIALLGIGLLVGGLVIRR